jgi:hypothetical protein
MTTTTTTIGCHSFIDILLWHQDGYWADELATPEWYDEDTFEQARQMALQAKPADVQLAIDAVRQEGSDWLTTYRIFDSANPQFDPWIITVHTKSEKSGREYAERELPKFKLYQTGDCEALMHYAKTGEARLQSWRPDSQLMGYRMVNGKRQHVQVYKKMTAEQVAR